MLPAPERLTPHAHFYRAVTVVKQYFMAIYLGLCKSTKCYTDTQPPTSWNEPYQATFMNCCSSSCNFLKHGFRKVLGSFCNSTAFYYLLNISICPMN